MLETEFEKYGALSFKTVLRSYCMVSDEGHDYALEVVMGKDAAQSFSFLFTGAGMKMDYSNYLSVMLSHLSGSCSHIPCLMFS